MIHINQKQEWHEGGSPWNPCLQRLGRRATAIEKYILLSIVIEKKWVLLLQSSSDVGKYPYIATELLYEQKGLQLREPAFEEYVTI